MADIVLRAQRPSVGRLVLPGLGALFMLALSVVSIANVVIAPATVAVVLMVVIVPTTAWLWWDLAKALGLAPLAKAEISSDAIVVHAPMLGWRGRRKAMVPGALVKVDVLRQSGFMGATYLYTFSQDDHRTTVVGPASVREADLDAFADALAEVDSPLEIGVMELGRGRGRR
ncbi:hypothetical protein [Demequina salsinemoris]|uniref:hypothetical protein n=1 Tax=Demequina salsinemoris TaxID=577470 RepID=UPI000781CF3F|nr:hypothetical protein [Demequina salsinemoris]